jgi:hypothetical protein
MISLILVFLFQEETDPTDPIFVGLGCLFIGFLAGGLWISHRYRHAPRVCQRCGEALKNYNAGHWSHHESKGFCEPCWVLREKLWAQTEVRIMDKVAERNRLAK